MTQLNKATRIDASRLRFPISKTAQSTSIPFYNDGIFSSLAEPEVHSGWGSDQGPFIKAQLRE